MGLSQTRQRFFEIRGTCQIVVKGHAYKDHPKRKFSEAEIKLLVKTKAGQILRNDFPSAIPDSVLFVLRDDKGRRCEIVLLIEESEITLPTGTTKKELIIVCSAYREVSDEV